MNVFASLKRIPLKDLFLHEAHEPARLEKTYANIKKVGVLRHPILATPVDEGYLVLDGAHRLQALRKLSCAYAPVQTLKPGELSLSSWIHQVPDGEWLDHWIEDSGVLVRPWQESAFPESRIIARMMRKGRTYALLAKDGGDDSPPDRLSLWHDLVATYNLRFQVCRLPAPPTEQIDSGSVYFHHPVWTLDKLVKAVRQGRVLPAGVTRFLVEGRILNLCVPLELLEENEVAFTRWSESVLYWSNHVRAYSEKVYLCEG